MKRLLLAGAAALAGGTSAPIVAQDAFFAGPNYGRATLRSGFSPDPHVLALSAGGSQHGGPLGCAAYFAAAPDWLLEYTTGSRPLIISAASSADTVLLIKAPDGRWHCDDDGGVRGRNPAIRFARPGSGRYEIRLGLEQSGQTAPATIHISRSRSQ